MNRNGKVEFMRFVFSVIIILFHCHRTLDFEYWMIGDYGIAALDRGYFGVEFFFLVTGFLMARSIFAKLMRLSSGKDTPVDLGQQTFRYFLKKYMSIFPYHVISFTLLVIVRLFTREIWGRADDVLQFFFDSVPEFFFLQKFGFTYTNVDVIEWFISAMLIAILLLYPIAFRFYSMFTRVIAPLLSLWILGIMQYNYGTFSNQTRWLGFGYACVFRAIAEIALGMSLYEASRFIGRYFHSERTRNIFTALEIFGFLLASVYSLSCYTSRYETHVLLFLAISIMLTFTGQTRGNRLFDKPFVYWLGKMSMPIYLCQLIGLALVNKFIKTPPVSVRILLVLAITFAVAVVCEHYGKKLQDIMQEKFKLPMA